MSKIDDLYNALARGSAQVPEDDGVVEALLDRVFEAHTSEDVEARLRAVRVAEAVGGQTALDLIETFIQDPSLAVRQEAFRIGVAARERGLRVVREAAHDPDVGLAGEALRLLTLARDREATPTARTLLSASEPSLRTGAVRLLGQIAGPSMRHDIERLLLDRDPQVRSAARDALARIDGKMPRAQAVAWWEHYGERDVLGSDTASHVPGAAPGTPFDTLAPEGSMSPEGTLSPERQGRAYQNESTWSPEIDKDEPVWLSHNPDVAERARGRGRWTGASISLPGELPSEARDLLRLLGLVSAEDRPPVLAAIAAADPQTLWRLVQSHRSGGDPARGRGIAIAAAALGQRAWLGQVRQLMSDNEPMVREVAYLGAARLGGPSILTQVSAGLSDADPRVRAATVRALTEACAEHGLMPILPNWLEQVASDPSDLVRQARADALARMRSAEGPSRP